MPDIGTYLGLASVCAILAAGVAIEPAHAAQGNSPSLPSTPQPSTSPATPQVPNSGVRYNNTSTWNSSAPASTPTPPSNPGLEPRTNSGLAPSTSPTLGPESTGRETDPGPARRGKAYDVKPLY